jgi:hypothetical protein
MAHKLDAISGSTLLLGLIAITAIVTPWHNLEPVGLPKLATLTVAVSLAGLLLILFHKSPYKFPKVFFLSTLIAIALAFLNVFINNQFISERIFGVSGRNFGALTFICLLLTSIISFSISEKVDSKKLLNAIKLSSFLVAIYFLAQLQGLDRAAWVDAYGGVPSSTLGNPNFVSAFVSIGFVLTLPLLLARQTKLPIRTLIFLISVLELYVSVESNSFQGLAIILLGFFYVALGFLRPVLLKLKKGYLATLFSLTTLITGFFLYRFQDPLSISSATIRARLVYWETGLAMGLDSPIFGKGFDYFGESYFLFRSETAAVRSPNLYTNSAHNYFIDLLASGGIPLLLATLLPILLVLRGKFLSIVRFQNFSEENKAMEAVIRGLFLAWLGFLFQALLSPFNIALAYLGFLLTGFLYGKFSEIKENKERSTHGFKKRAIPRGGATKAGKNGVILKVFLAPLFISLPFLGFQPLIADAKFRDGIEQGNGELIYRIALSQPKNFQLMRYAAETFIQNQREDLATPIIRQMVEQNPGNLAGWRLLEGVTKTEADKAEIRAKILALDPKNPELKNS